MDTFERVLRESRRAEQEELNQTFQQVYDEFKLLENVIDEEFGDVAPNLSDCRTVLKEMNQALSDILERKRVEEPDPSLTRSPEGPGNTAGSEPNPPEAGST